MLPSEPADEVRLPAASLPTHDEAHRVSDSWATETEKRHQMAFQVRIKVRLKTLLLTRT